MKISVIIAYLKDVLAKITHDYLHFILKFSCWSMTEKIIALTVPHFWGTRSCLVPLPKLNQPFLPRSFFAVRNGVPFSVPFSVPFLLPMLQSLLLQSIVFTRSRFILAFFEVLTHFSLKRLREIQILRIFYGYLGSFHRILMQKERKRNGKGTVRSFWRTSDFRGIRSCLVPFWY